MRPISRRRFKPATLTPLSALNFVRILEEAGIPRGVVNLVTGGGGDVGNALLVNDAVRVVSFTGSTENWGREPFRKVGHGHYGLGLYRVRNIIEAHRGRLHVRHDQPSSSLVTTVVLPLAHAQ